MKKPNKWRFIDIMHNPEGALKAGVPLAKIHGVADTLHQFVVSGAKTSKNQPAHPSKPH